MDVLFSLQNRKWALRLVWIGTQGPFTSSSLPGTLYKTYAEMVGVSRNTISSIETGQFSPTAKLALILCIALDQKFEDLFYFD